MTFELCAEGEVGVEKKNKLEERAVLHKNFLWVI